MNMSQFYPGKRLSYDGSLCTVRYVGTVEGTKGDWLGVEWDEPSRGKHSGAHNGVTYFECLSKSPTAGSFIRPNRPSDQPRTFIEALKKKYASDPVEEVDADIRIIGKAPPEVLVNSAGRVIKISGKVAEEVGFDKIRRRLADLHELRIVLLDGLCIRRDTSSGSETASDIKDTSPKIRELDLSRNLFEQWREIAAICSQLEDLRILRVDGNRFIDTSLESSTPSPFSKVASLSLENTLLSWTAVAEICSNFPALSALTVADNAFSTLPDATFPTTITEIDLERNDFHSISDLTSLSKLPNLRKLNLKKNPISSTTSSSPPSTQPQFPPSLTDLDLSHAAITSWTTISALPTTFPGLTALRIAHNPLFLSLQTPDGRPLTPDDGYMLTIARLPGLKNLNYSPITPKERLNAEVYYLSQIAAELSLHPVAQAEGILAGHPRFKALCEEYGEPNVVRRDEGAAFVIPNSLATRLVKFTFVLGEETRKKIRDGVPSEVVLELPRSLTVYAALGVVGRKFGLSPLEIRLFWETGDREAGNAEEQDGRAEEWDSEDEGDGNVEEQIRGDLFREVEWVAGTKLIGTWVEGSEARVRVELR
ncbi:tubulin-specific chaperone E [Saccharata proteae CBS 121410]|uniref:Tubulin-specific chaperone E n=1 Tax=Saccharata proteae CBS 121410 TaxID=1314787 RepID=A0A6A5YAA0_9PEZI|nr:tubulin-specific chaperone E [Saccharata proteae CBS 121410]